MSLQVQRCSGTNVINVVAQIWFTSAVRVLPFHGTSPLLGPGLLFLNTFTDVNLGGEFRNILAPFQRAAGKLREWWKDSRLLSVVKKKKRILKKDYDYVSVCFDMTSQHSEGLKNNRRLRLGWRVGTEKLPHVFLFNHRIDLFLHP